MASDRLQQDLLSHNLPGMLRKDGEKVILDWCEDDLPSRQGHQVQRIHRDIYSIIIGILILAGVITWLLITVNPILTGSG